MAETAPHMESKEWVTNSDPLERMGRMMYDLYVGSLFAFFELLLLAGWIPVIALLVGPEQIAGYISVGMLMAAVPLGLLRMGHVEGRSQCCSPWPDYFAFKTLASKWVSQVRTEGVVHLFFVHALSVGVFSLVMYLYIFHWSFWALSAFILIMQPLLNIHTYIEKINTKVPFHGE